MERISFSFISPWSSVVASQKMLECGLSLEHDEEEQQDPEQADCGSQSIYCCAAKIE